MSQNIVLSVIVPVYNTAPWLRKCLDSICSQSYKELEILCVNDGSTDNSADILEEYAARDSRIKVFTQKNAGLAAARNTGLENATGEWVTGVDSDDWLYPGIYEKAVGCITEAVDMVFFGVRNVDEAGVPLPHNRYFDLPAAGEYSLSSKKIFYLNVCFPSKLWRRSLIEDNHLRFPAGLVHEDEAMYALAAPYVRRISICPTIGYAYAQRENSIMHESGLDDLRRIRRFIPIAEFVYAEYEKRDLLHSPARKHMLSLFKGICMHIHNVKQQEVKQRALKEVLPLIEKYGMLEEDYIIERIQPFSRSGIITITRYRCAKVYRIGSIPIWVKWYTFSGRPLTPDILVHHIKKRLARILFRARLSNSSS